jgi:hypothetical protein
MMICQCIKQWFAYHSQCHVSRTETNWANLIQCLHEPSNPKPRKRSVVQQFVLENTAQVDAAFVSKYGEGRGMDGAERMNKRQDLAKRILYGEHKNQIPALENRAREDHKQEIKQWSMLLDDITQASDVDT